MPTESIDEAEEQEKGEREVEDEKESDEGEAVVKTLGASLDR